MIEAENSCLIETVCF